jgi:hypothetical protein
MPRAFHSALLAVLAALFCLQPAVRAGASCAQEMLTWSCGCAAAASEPDAHAGCTRGGEDAGSPADSDSVRSASGCTCELAPVPDAPARAAQHGSALQGAGLAGHDVPAWIELCAAEPVLAGAALRARLPGLESPPGASATPHDFASRAGAVRFLTFLCTSRR